MFDPTLLRAHVLIPMNFCNRIQYRRYACAALIFKGGFITVQFVPSRTNVPLILVKLDLQIRGY